MPQQFISCGPITPLLAGVAYALPAVNAVLFCDAATPAISQSGTPAFTNSVALTFTNGQAAVSGGFIKSTTAVSVKLARN